MAIDEAAEIAELHRVLELQHQACLDDPELKRVLQERAYTSPIWYSP